MGTKKKIVKYLRESKCAVLVPSGMHMKYNYFRYERMVVCASSKYKQF